MCGPLPRAELKFLRECSVLSTLSQRRLEENAGSFAEERANGSASRLTAGDCNHIGRMRWQNQYQHLVLTEVDDTSRIVGHSKVEKPLFFEFCVRTVCQIPRILSSEKRPI